MLTKSLVPYDLCIGVPILVPTYCASNQENPLEGAFSVIVKSS